MRTITIIFLLFFLFSLYHEVNAVNLILTEENPKGSSVVPKEKTLSRDEVELIASKIADERLAQIKQSYDQGLREIAEGKLRVAHVTITVAGAVVGLFSVIFGLLAYLGVRSLSEAKKETEKLRKVRKKIEEFHTELETSTENIWSRFNIHLGYSYWQMHRALLELGQRSQLLPKPEKQKNLLLEWAISFTKRAIDPPKIDKKIRQEASLVTAKLNLAYFYSETKENKEAALDYVKSVQDKIYFLAQYEELKEYL